MKTVHKLALYVVLLLIFFQNLSPKLIVYFDREEYKNIGYDNCTMATNGELKIIEELIKDNDTVFDVGANRGEWSEIVLHKKKGVTVFAFEPIPSVYEQLHKKSIDTPQLLAFNMALGDYNGSLPMYIYDHRFNLLELSSLYERPILKKLLGKEAKSIEVKIETLDTICQNNTITNIDFLKIDTEGAELAVLKGAHTTLSKKIIQTIQFEYGGTFLDSKTTLKEIFYLLQENEYKLYRILPNGLLKLPTWEDSLENFTYSNYIASLKELE